MSTARTASQGERWILAAITLLLALLFAALVAPTYLFTGDPEHYVGLAREIAEGGSYAVNGRPEVRFPPGFPFILAPAAWIARGEFAAISRWAAALAGLAFLFTWLYARRRVGWLAIPVALLTVCSTSFLSLATGNPMSEPVYLTLSMALFLWAERERREPPGREWGAVLLGCGLLVALPATRMFGVAAVAAAGVVFVLDARTEPGVAGRSQLRDALPALAGVAFLLAWFYWVETHRMRWYSGGGDGSYLENFLQVDPDRPSLGRITPGAILDRIGENAVIQAAHIGELLTPIPWLRPSWYSPVWLVLPLLAAGWWRELKTGARFASIYFALYVAVVLLWPYDEATRFLLPVVPLLWIYLIAGVRWLGDGLRKDRRSIRFFGLLLCGAALLGVAVAERPHSRQDLAAAGAWFLAAAVLLPGWNRLTAAARRWSARWTRWAVFAGVTLFVLASVARVGPLILRRASGPEKGTEPPGMVASAWILANTPRDAVIQATLTTRINFVTGRRVVPLPSSASPMFLQEIQRRYQPRFVVLLDAGPGDTWKPDTEKFAVLEQLFPDRWQRVHQFRGGSIYEFR